ATLRLKARINALRSTLEEIKLTFQARQLLARLAQHGSLYCTSCTPLLQPGACGRTCPLLRPRDRLWAPEISGKWLERVNAEFIMYRDVVEDMGGRGYNVHPATVRRWERVIATLRDSGQTCTEAHDDACWQLIKRIDCNGAVDKTWNFEERWRKRLDIDDDIAPEK
ncbi:hypothetical protein BKA66DRAFT_372622, partial [Pyrenochaeta sp. MPI-SDFR-AT-0127]